MSTLLSFWSQLTLKSLLDILVVAFLIYQGLLIVHGTRAVQMLFGLGILVGLFWAGHSFQLYSLNWILDHFFDSFFIIAIILFQDQFRNALAEFGTGRSFTFLFGNSNKNVEIDEIVEAVRLLGRRRVGALIVIERSQGLGSYKSTGTIVDSRIHSDLIFAIFQSSGPLHDGALMIQGSTLVSAGCFLPLSRNLDLDRHMGTRHRAALGVSENTDAIAIVVSEETGKISLAVEAKLYRLEKAHELRKYLGLLMANEKLDRELSYEKR